MFSYISFKNLTLFPLIIITIYISILACNNVDHKEIFQNGIQAVENKDYNQSVIFFKQYIELEPNDINGFINISNAYYQTDQFENSTEYIKKALKIDPGNLDALKIQKNLKTKYMKIGNDSAINGDFKKAIKNFLKYSELEPNDINGFINISKAYYEIDELENSMEYISKALKIDPDFRPAIEIKNLILNSFQGIFMVDNPSTSYQEAIRFLEKFINSNPNDIQGLIAITSIMYRKSSIEIHNMNKKINSDTVDTATQSLEYIAKALKIDPENIEILSLKNLVENLYFDMGYKEIQTNNDFKKAIEYFEQYLQLEPNDINRLINISNAYYRTNQFENANEYIKNALKIDPYNPEALSLQKNSLYSIGQKSVDNNDFKKAIEYFEQYIKLEPNDINGLINISNAYYQTDQLENATEYIAKALEIDSSNPGALYLQKNIKNQYAKLLNQGLKYFDENQFDESIGIFKQYINYDNTNIKILVKLGVAHKHMKLYDQALEYFSQAINLDETYSDAYLQIAIIANINENYSNALQNLKLADNYNRNNPEIYFEKAKSYWNLNDLENAITNFDKVIELSDPEKSIYQTSLNLKNQAISKQNQLNPPTIYINVNDAIVYFSRGVDNQIIGDDEKAIEDFNSALKIDPNYRDAYFSRGVSYKNIGNYTKAIEDFNSALEIDPNFFPAIIEKNSISN